MKPDGVSENLYQLNPSGRTMALGSTQSLNRNDYQGTFLRGKGGRFIGMTTLPPSCADCLTILGVST